MISRLFGTVMTRAASMAPQDWSTAILRDGGNNEAFEATGRGRGAKRDFDLRHGKRQPCAAPPSSLGLVSPLLRWQGRFLEQPPEERGECLKTVAKGGEPRRDSGADVRITVAASLRTSAAAVLNADAESYLAVRRPNDSA